MVSIHLQPGRFGEGGVGCQAANFFFTSLFFPAKTTYVFFLFTVSPSTLHHHHHLLKLGKAKRLRPAEKKQGEGGESFLTTNV